MKLPWRIKFKSSTMYLMVAIILIVLLVSPIESIQQNRHIISSQGTIKKLTWLHADGKFLKNEYNETVFLRGCVFIEADYEVDKLKNDQSLELRANRFRELGVNLLRITINKEKWDENRDSNGDGIGNRDFTIQAIKMFTSKGIYVIPGLMAGWSDSFYSDATEWANWLIENLVVPFIDNPGVCGVFVMNEPRYGAFGGTNLGGGLTSGYWSAVKQVCQAIHKVNPNLLIIVHADMWNQEGFCPILKTDPIPVPNVVYNWHFYYIYAPALCPYLGWKSGIPDPDFQEMVNKNMSYYQSYHFGNYTQARQEFESWLYNKFLWVSAELNLPIINDEFGFTGNEEPYYYYRYCTNCGWFGRLGETKDSSGHTPQPPYPSVTYCPICGAEIPRPRGTDFEPGWGQCLMDFTSILTKYHCLWTYFSWWPHVYGSYGLTNNDATSLSHIGEIWKHCLEAAPTIISQ